MAYLKKISTRVLIWTLAALLSAFLPYPSRTARAQTAESWYVAKLATGHTRLPDLAGEPRKLFDFSSSLELARIVRFRSSLSLEEISSRLAGKVEWLQTDRPVRAAALDPVVVNDPGFTSNPQNIDKQWALAKAGFLNAWSKTTGSASTTVAVIDTGLDATHEDLQSLRLAEGRDFFSGRAISGNVNSDDNGHGTVVTGILGASVNNGLGIAGASWQVRIMPLKALDAEGKGDSSTVSQAIVWAADNGADFINLSLGGIGFGHDAVLAEAISYAHRKGALVVAAAGNDSAADGVNLDNQPVFPVCDGGGNNEVLGVAAVDHNDLKTNFSNYGKNCIDISAPGKRILSTINYDPLLKTYTPNSYAYFSGTSVAVPMVVGAAALVKAMHPQASNAAIRDHLLETAAAIDQLNLSQCAGLSCKGLLGRGRLDVAAAAARDMPRTQVQEGDLVGSGAGSDQRIYQILGGQKRPVSLFVFQQRFSSTPVKSVEAAQLAAYPDGPYAAPLDGTLVKSQTEPAVYLIRGGIKSPVTYQVFRQRKFDFAAVAELDAPQVNSWIKGSFLPPGEGTLARAPNNPTVYWVVGQTLHPVNEAFYRDRGLYLLEMIVVAPGDLASFPKGEAYLR